MRLAVIGTGYVGLVAGAGFSDFGNDVVCVDVDADRIAALRQGECPIHEPGLPDLIRENAAAGRLTFTTSIAEAVKDAEVVFLAVGTPSLPDGSADLSQVLAVAEEVARALTRETVVVTKSTVPVGTASRLHEIIVGRPGAPARAVASNPEFLKEGSAVKDFMRPERVIIGIGSGKPYAWDELNQAEDRARSTMRRLYAPIVRTNDRLLFTDARSAEMTKYAANAYLATRVSFMNDIANLCERLGADVEMVRRGMGMDTRIGPKFLFPGLGWGGSCFLKDVRSITHTARQAGVRLSIIEAAQDVNERQRTRFREKIARHFETGQSRPLEGKTIAVWGLAFKPETDDVREAPALSLIEWLTVQGAIVQASDPAALTNAKQHFGGPHRSPSLRFLDDPYEAARGADALVLCTEWRQYRQPDWTRIKGLMRGTGVFDGRNAWDPTQVRAAGFTYYGVGRR